MRIGLQSNTEATYATTENSPGHLVSQAYCSAFPVGYSDQSASSWEPLAWLMLDTTYEATFSAAATNAERTGNRNVLLTLVGGRVFGNWTGWILNAIRRASTLHDGIGIGIGLAIVGYGSSTSRARTILT